MLAVFILYGRVFGGAVKRLPVAVFIFLVKFRRSKRVFVRVVSSTKRWPTLVNIFPDYVN